jgi:hypothetical protein
LEAKEPITLGGKKPIYSNRESAAAAPIFDQSVIVHQTAGDMARRIILKVAPDLP